MFAYILLILSRSDSSSYFDGILAVRYTSTESRTCVVISENVVPYYPLGRIHSRVLHKVSLSSLNYYTIDIDILQFV
ncbi:hypothetical protein GcM3_04518 [Golovinomyces cichoracearum]|uniref:Uncharacterized protein n=1 Tax=Golovinomyces cichoracearum TaxID=62708 RepID=A0A420HDM1_9PEZI|nr:hypothetical protein GcM3_04518 [Golovinomyces cichoracearum]